MFRILTFCFNILWLVLVNWDEPMRLASRFPPLCCYFADHCQLIEVLWSWLLACFTEWDPLSIIELFLCLQNMFAFFDVRVTMHRDKFHIIEPTTWTNFSILFWNKTLHVLDSSSVHHQEFFSVHTAMGYVIQVCWQLVSRSKCSRSQSVSRPVRHIPLLCVQWKTRDDGQRNCPKHVELYSKIKLKN